MANRHALIVPALKKHTATVIMAHGLGDSGAGWVSLAENWRKRSKFEEVKFIFPNAPSIPITIVCCQDPYLITSADSVQNGGWVMPGWYDIVRRRDDVRHSFAVPQLILHAAMLICIADKLQRPPTGSR